MPSNQNIMTDGPGLRDRARETNAVVNTVAPKTTAAPAKPEPVSPRDKVNPKAMYGSKPGEKRLDVSDALKPLGSFKHGTDYVPKTGMYKLHEGEAVKTKEENMDSSWAGKINAGSEKKPKKEIKEIRTTRTHDGKLMHKHIHHHPEHHEEETHISNSMEEAQKHMADHAGDPSAEGGAGDSQMAQLTASPSPMPSPDAGGAGAAGAPPAA